MKLKTFLLTAVLIIVQVEFDVTIQHMWPLRKQMRGDFKKLRSGDCKTILSLTNTCAWKRNFSSKRKRTGYHALFVAEIDEYLKLWLLCIFVSYYCTTNAYNTWYLLPLGTKMRWWKTLNRFCTPIYAREGSLMHCFWANSSWVTGGQTDYPKYSWILSRKIIINFDLIVVSLYKTNEVFINLFQQ